jgi:hypothetical protein
MPKTQLIDKQNITFKITAKLLSIWEKQGPRGPGKGRILRKFWRLARTGTGRIRPTRAIFVHHKNPV